MSSKRLDSLADYTRHGYKLRLDCACGRIVVMEPHALLRIIMERGWSGYSMEGLAMKLKCQQCGKPPRQIGPCLGTKT